MRNRWQALPLAVAAFSAGCGGHYVTLDQRVANPGSVLAAPLVSLPPLQFAFQPPPDWESPAAWATHVALWTAAFGEEMTRRADALGGRTIRMLPPGVVVHEGVVVVATVLGIERGNAISGDEIAVEVRVLDGRDNAPLLTANLRVSSFRYDGGPEVYTFGGRMKYACRNLAEAILAALRRGEF